MRRKTYFNMISIIIPTLNEEKLLPGLLKAIKSQNFKNYEIIISDAGSQDKTIEIAKEFGCKITNGGLPGKGRNNGANVAKYNILFFLDADSIFFGQDFFTNFLDEFEKRNLDIATFLIYAKGNNKIDKFIYRAYNFSVCLVENFLPHATNAVLVKKEIHKKINGFDEQIKIAEDHDYARRAGKFGKFGIIKTEPILVSARRYETDGRFKTYFKYILCAIYMNLFGPVKSDIFKYKFGHYNK